MATITKTIGSAGGRDYSTIAAWYAGVPANLVTAGNSYVGQCFNDSEFTSATQILSLSGNTTDATHTLTLTTGTGQSFRDNANAQTNALKYNQANGVGIKCTGTYVDTMAVGFQNVFFSNLQITHVGDHGRTIQSSGSGQVAGLDDCIIEGDNNYTGGNSGIINCSVKLARNSVFISRLASMNFVLGAIAGAGAAEFHFCTIVQPSNLAAAAAVVDSQYNTLLFKNCAFFGCTAIASAATTTTVTYTTCMTDIASPPSGVTGSKTYGNQFQNTTNASGDWRLKTGADLIDAGTTDSTNGANDIVGTARPSGSSYDIGCWEFVAAASTSPFQNYYFPNPLGRLFPADQRGFLNPVETQLIGKDLFYGAPGETKTYDYPNPRGPAFPIDNRTFVNPIEIQLAGKDKFFAAAGQPPTYDYPNPRGAPFPSDNRTFLNPVETQLIGLDKFFGAPGEATARDYPNPGRPPWPTHNYTHLRATELNLLPGKDQFFGAPGEAIARDYPNPGRPILPTHNYTHIRSIELNLLSQDAFFGAAGQAPANLDWPVPKGPQPGIITNRTHVQAVKIELIGKDQFFGAAGQPPVFDWPNPTRRQWPATDAQAQNLLATLLSLLSPFSQWDWPNPRGNPPPIDLRTHLDRTRLQLLGQDQFFGAPGQAPTYSWPNPQRQFIPPQDLPPSLLATLLAVVQAAVPFIPPQWLNPGTRPTSVYLTTPLGVVEMVLTPVSGTPHTRGFIVNVGGFMRIG